MLSDPLEVDVQEVDVESLVVEVPQSAPGRSVTTRAGVGMAKTRNDRGD